MHATDSITHHFFMKKLKCLEVDDGLNVILCLIYSSHINMYSQNTCFYNPFLLFVILILRIIVKMIIQEDLQRFIDVIVLTYFIDKRIFMPNVKYLKHFKLLYHNFSLFAQKLIGRPRPSTGLNLKIAT